MIRTKQGFQPENRKGKKGLKPEKKFQPVQKMLRPRLKLFQLGLKIELRFQPENRKGKKGLKPEKKFQPM